MARLAYNAGMQATASSGRGMDFASQWQGQIVDGRFPLEQYVGGSDRDAVFSTRLENGAKVAIKLVRAAACDPAAQIAAWKSATKLSHPHLIRVFACGRSWIGGNDLLFVVTEFADENLGQVLPHRALTTTEAEVMLRASTSALEYLHGQGLVHGHIRPANVMAINEQVKLTSDRIQHPGPPVQTFEASPYDAPELASLRLSAATDMWSLGATVAETLTQRVPTRAEGLSLLQPFADVVRNTLVREPESRWNIGDVRARLEPAARRNTDSARAQVSARPATTSRAPIWIVGALVATAIIVVAVFMRRGPQTPEPVRPTVSSTASAPVPSQARSVVQDSPGSVLSRVLPNPSRGALDTITGHVKVRLRVSVDAAGNVVNATFTDHGPSEYFARLALQAAERWKFAPKIRDGRAGASEWNLLFTYSRGGVQASEQAVRTR